MEKLTRSDLMSLETYAEQRKAFRAGVLEHKKYRKLALGETPSVDLSPFAVARFL